MIFEEEDLSYLGFSDFDLGAIDLCLFFFFSKFRKFSAITF